MAGNDAYTKLLIHSDTTDGSITFVDSSSVGRGISAFGQVHHEVDQHYFGASSIYFEGSGDYLTMASAADLAFGTGDFTVDFWLRMPSFPANSYVFDFGVNGALIAVAVGKIRFYNPSTGTGGTLYNNGPTLSANTWYHVAIVRSSGSTAMYINGSQVAVQADARNYPASILSVGQYGAGGNNLIGYIDEFRVSVGIARWSANFAPPTEPYAAVVATTTVLAMLEQSWGDRSIVAASLSQRWGVKMGADLHQAWTDAPVVRAILSQPWGNASVLRAELRQRWESSFTLRATLEQGWHIYGVVQVELAQRWAITADLVRGVLEQGWDLRERDLLRAELLQRWALEADGTVLRYQVAVDVDGVAVGFSHINIEGGLDQDVLSCELHLGSEGDYLRCLIGSEVAVSITSAAGAEQFSLVITAPRITEEHGSTQYIVEAMSPVVLLGEPYASPIEGELSGMASAIAATLAGAVPLAWQTVDWEIPTSTWIAAGETPLALLKALAAAVGAVVQSLPDGSVVIMPEWPVSINRLALVAPDLTLVENLDCWTTGSTPELKSGYNRFLIGDQLTTANTLRLDEEAISDTAKVVRGYQTPWTGAFDLAHTGGDWVVIEPLGIEERQETETIEMVAGAGRVQYPIYSRDVVEWGQVNLGSVTVSEDGSVQAAVAGESLLTITYTTRCRKWQVRDPRNEQLQLVVPA